MTQRLSTSAREPLPVSQTNSMLKIQTFPNRPIDENTYVVSDETREAVIIDCGALFPDDQQAIAHYIESENLKVVLHLLTHGHFDHMFGSQWVADTYGVLPRLHAADTDFYLGAPAMMSAFFHRPFDFPVPRLGAFISEGEEVSFGSHVLRVIPTPGHTPGGCCFFCEEERILFSGDSLFQGSIGRTDMQGGDHVALIHGLAERILSLPEAVKVFPGHGPTTTIEAEKRYNPYF